MHALDRTEPLPPIDLTPAQARTLQMGSLIVLASVALGMQVGNWPDWSPAAAATAYLAWTLAYAEATARRMRR